MVVRVFNSLAIVTPNGDIDLSFRVMGWCLNQCWLVTSEVQWQSHEINFLRPQPSMTKIDLKITYLKFHWNLAEMFICTSLYYPGQHNNFMYVPVVKYSIGTVLYFTTYFQNLKRLIKRLKMLTSQSLLSNFKLVHLVWHFTGDNLKLV